MREGNAERGDDLFSAHGARSLGLSKKNLDEESLLIARIIKLTSPGLILTK